MAADQPGFDVKAAHRYFAADCFNKAWDLIDKQSRTPEEDRLMISLNQASIYHWTEREDWAMAFTDQVEDKAERELLLNDLSQIPGLVE